MIDLNLTQPITENGLNEIKLLDDSFKLRTHIYNNASDWESDSEVYTSDFVFFTYKKSIMFQVNIHIGKIVSIEFKGEYKGKIWNNIGVGSSVNDLLKIKKDFTFDDRYIFIKNSDNLLFEIDDEIDSLEEAKHKNIKKIIICNEKLCLIAIGESEFPVEWQKYRVTEN